MHIGITSTREGLTSEQLRLARDLLYQIKAKSSQEMFLHHGDCVGGDSQIHQIAKGLGYSIVIHPPNKDTLRAFCEADELREPREYLVRNWDIVGECNVLLVFPRGPETRRSGTWATYRHAKKLGIPRIIIYPDGNCIREG